MRYMLIAQTISQGGAERVISVLANALSKLGSEVIVVKYFSTEGEYRIENQVKVINLTGGDYQDYKRGSKLISIINLRKIIKDTRPSCIIPFTLPVAELTDIACIGLNVNIIQTMRIDPASSPKQLWKRWIRDFLVYKSKCTFVQNATQKAYFKSRYHKTIHILSNPVDDSFFNIVPKKPFSSFIVSGVGRLTEQKNFKLLIDAFSAAFHDIENAELRIYGEGKLKDDLQKHIELKGMKKQIRLMGRTDDMKTVYENTDVYVLSSNWEGMPNTLIEAMASNVFCISTNCPTGPAELIEDGKNGYLVPVSDFEALKNALWRTYNMPYKDRLLMSENARRIVRDKCASSKIAYELNSVCESIVEKGCTYE